jgi:colicin import membrane protein
MPQRRRSSAYRAFIYALAVHLAVIAVLLVNVELFARKSPPLPADSTIVRAVAVDQNKVEAEIKRLQEREKRKQEEERARQERLKREEDETKRRREEEERRLVKLKEEQEQIEKKKHEEEHELKLAEEQRKFEEQRRREAEQQRKEAEQKALAEKQKAKAEKKRREEERRKQEEEQKQRREKELQEALATEEHDRVEAERQRQDQSEIDKYIRKIKAKIEGTFINPAKGLRCKIFIRMIPGGEVVEAKVVQSSGNPNFDRRAEIAVHKAAPLPVPDEPRLFRELKELYFDFEPEG